MPVLEISKRLTRPLYLYIKYGEDMRRISEWWWSESPSMQDSLSNICSHIEGLRLPHVELYVLLSVQSGVALTFIVPRNERRYMTYFQLEPEDVSRARFASITLCA